MSKGYITCHAPHKENWENFCQHELSLEFCAPKNDHYCPYFYYFPAPSIYQRVRDWWFLNIKLNLENLQYAIFHPHDNKILQEEFKKPEPPSTELTMTYEEWFNSLPPMLKEYYVPSSPEGQRRKSYWRRLEEYKKWLKRHTTPLIELAKLYGKDCVWGGCENCLLNKPIKKVPTDDEGNGIILLDRVITLCGCFNLITANYDEGEYAKKSS